MNAYSATVGRILIAIVFIIEGALKVFDFEGFWHALEIDDGIPAAPFVAILVVIIELGGGISLILGFNARFFSFVMAIYLLIVTLVEYHAWVNADGNFDQGMFELFVRNLAIIGGLLMVNSHGAGPSSVDESHVFDV